MEEFGARDIKVVGAKSKAALDCDLQLKWRGHLYQGIGHGAKELSHN